MLAIYGFVGSLAMGLASAEFSGINVRSRLADVVANIEDFAKVAAAAAAAQVANDPKDLLREDSNSLRISTYDSPPVYIADKPRAPVDVHFFNSTTIVLDRMEDHDQRVGEGEHVDDNVNGRIDSLVVQCSIDVNEWIMEDLGLRACLRVKSAVVHPISGRIERQDIPRAVCFAGVRKYNLSVPALSPGKHQLSVALWNTLNEQIGPASVVIPVAIATHYIFQPAYSWAFVQDWQNVPSGLEIRLPIDGTGERVARIPDPWRLQLYLGDGEGFFRGSVRRRWTGEDVLKAVARDKRIPAQCLDISLPTEGLWADPELNDESANQNHSDFSEQIAANVQRSSLLNSGAITVEALRLFERSAALVARVERSAENLECLCAGVTACAHVKRLHRSCVKDSSRRDGCGAEKSQLDECNEACGVKSDEEIAREKQERREEQARRKQEQEDVKKAAKAAAAALESRTNAQKVDTYSDEEDDDEEEALWFDGTDTDNEFLGDTGTTRKLRIPVVHSSASSPTKSKRNSKNERFTVLDNLLLNAQRAAADDSSPREAGGDHDDAAEAEVDASQWANILIQRERERLLDMSVQQAIHGVGVLPSLGSKQQQPEREAAPGHVLFAEIGEDDAPEEDEVIDLSMFVL